MKSGIYRLYWDNCDYFYYGQSVDIEKRYNGHVRCIRNKKHQNKIITDVSSKHGEPKMEVVMYCDVDALDFNEQIFLDKSKLNKKCCNVLWVASSPKGHKHAPRSLEYRKKLSNSLKGKIVTKETREKLRVIFTGRKRSEFSKKRQSDSTIGIKKSESHRANIIKAMIGRKLSVNHKTKIGNSKKGNTYRRGVKLSIETKLKCSNSQKKNIDNIDRIKLFNIDRRKRINKIDISTGFIVDSFESICNANLLTGTDRKSISQCCRNIRVSSNGFKWQYA